MIATLSLPSLEEIERLNQEFESATPQEILRWAVETYFPKLCVTSSFGASSGAILHMISQINSDVPVAFLQTHYHFEETLRFRDTLAEKYGLTVENWEAWGGRPHFLKHYPDDLNKRENLDGLPIPEAAQGKVKTGVDLCCWLNKVEPLARALKNRYAYITSLRRDGGTERRRNTRILEAYAAPHREVPLVKINPMANWSKKDLWKYIYDNEVPVHELWVQGYRSIGCAPCTLPVGTDEDERSGRWSGTYKAECGIHTSQEPINYSI